MRFAAHQPEYLPGLSFFHKMSQADVIVLADDLQYSPHSLTNRCRIKTAEGAHWLTVPVRTKGKRSQKINEVKIINEADWRQNHWKTIFYNYRTSPYFDKYAEAIQEQYAKSWNSLADLNVATIELIRSALGISTPFVLNSTLKINTTASERIVEMARKLGCNQYVSESSGREYLREDLFREAGIDLVYMKFRHPVYHQAFGSFVPELSAIDLLFNEGEEGSEVLGGAPKK